MNFSPVSSAAPSVHQTPKGRKRSRILTLSGGMMILDWLFLVVCGLGLGIALVACSILTAMF